MAGATPAAGLDMATDENANGSMWGMMGPQELSTILRNTCEKVLLIDSRSFLEFNTSSIQQSVNVSCSKLVKRRLQQDKVQIEELVRQTCEVDVDGTWDVIVYDQCTEDPGVFTADNFVHVLLRKLSTAFNSVSFLSGGFLAFQAMHPLLVENKASSGYRCTALTSLSQPCLPVSNVGPTRILPFLYLGSSQDALSLETAQINGINYVLNVSTNCPRPAFVQEGHFLRIPIGDNYSEKILPFIPEAFQFLDKVHEANGCVLVHCLAGISRSPTLAIAFIMKHMRMSSDDAYRYVKDKRATISPNFNFLGQLLEYETLVRREEEEGRQRCQRPHPLSPVPACSHPSSVVMDLQVCSPPSPSPRNTPRPSFDFDQHTGFPCAASPSTDLGEVGGEAVVRSRSRPVVPDALPVASPMGPCVAPEALAPSPAPACQPEPEAASSAPFPGPSTNAPSTLGFFSPLPGPNQQQPSTCGGGLTSPLPGPSMDQPSTCPLAGPPSTLSCLPVSSRRLQHVPMPGSPFPGPGDSGGGTVPCLGPRYSSVKAARSLTSGFMALKRSAPCDFSSADSSADDGLTGRTLSLGSSIAMNASSGEIAHHSTLAAKVSHTDWPTDTASSLTGPHSSGLPLSPSRPGSLAGLKQRDRPFTLDLSPVSDADKDSDTNSSEPTTPDRPGSGVTGSGGGRRAGKLAPCRLRLTTAPLHMLPSPTSAMARLNMSASSPARDATPDSPSSSEPAGASGSQDGELPFCRFPTTSLDQLSFTPCYVPEAPPPACPVSCLTAVSTATKSGAVKRPLSATAWDGQPASPMSVSSLGSPTSLLSPGSPIAAALTSKVTEGSESGSGSGSGDLVSPMSISSQSSASSSSSAAGIGIGGGSSIASPTTSSSVTTATGGAGPSSGSKVVLRSRDKSKRSTVRPNSIAFSTYPTCDLADASPPTASWHDDASQAYLNHASKKLRPNGVASEPTSERKFRWGRYSEREVYRQISAAMEKAMLRTQVYEASRRARSLDDILGGVGEGGREVCQCCLLNRVSRRCGLPAAMDPFSPQQCRCGTSAEPYQSNSSISSGGSHSSLHGSMEIIQAPGSQFDYTAVTPVI